VAFLFHIKLKVYDKSLIQIADTTEAIEFALKEKGMKLGKEVHVISYNNLEFKLFSPNNIIQAQKKTEVEEATGSKKRKHGVLLGNSKRDIVTIQEKDFEEIELKDENTFMGSIWLDFKIKSG